MSTLRTGRLGRTELLADLAVNLGLAVVIGRRTITSRYKQTFLGLGWTLLQPLATLVIFTVFFGGLAGIDAGGGSYTAFALSALVPWQFFAGVVAEGSAALATEANLIKKVAVSRAAVVVGRSGAALVPFAVGLALMAVLGPVVGARLSLHLLWLPVLSVLVAVPALALAAALSAIGVYNRDVNFGLPFLMQALLFASPVAFPVVGLSGSWQRIYAVANPVVGPLEGFRRVYVLGQAPAFDLLALSAATSLVVLVIGAEIFRRLEPGFADVI